MIIQTSEKFTQITAKYESLLDEIAKASTKLGEMKSLKPLYEMITLSKGESIPVYISMLSLLESLLIWQKTNHMPLGMDKHIKYLQNILREEIAKH
jgi:hypothetical protein